METNDTEDDMAAPTSPFFTITQVEQDGLAWIQGAIPMHIAVLMLAEFEKTA